MVCCGVMLIALYFSTYVCGRGWCDFAQNMLWPPISSVTFVLFRIYIRFTSYTLLYQMGIPYALFGAWQVGYFCARSLSPSRQQWKMPTGLDPTACVCKNQINKDILPPSQNKCYSSNWFACSVLKLHLFWEEGVYKTVLINQLIN
jgi:hypothetical protein